MLTNTVYFRICLFDEAVIAEMFVRFSLSPQYHLPIATHVPYRVVLRIVHLSFLVDFFGPYQPIESSNVSESPGIAS